MSNAQAAGLLSVIAGAVLWWSAARHPKFAAPVVAVTPAVKSRQKK
jgi:hypothetical protein